VCIPSFSSSGTLFCRTSIPPPLWHAEHTNGICYHNGSKSRHYGIYSHSGAATELPHAAAVAEYKTRHRSSTSMYSLTFCVRFLLPERHQWKPAVQTAAVMLTTPPSAAGRRPAARADPDRHTHRHTDTHTRVTTIHFASSTTHAKCNNNWRGNCARPLSDYVQL